MTVVVVPNAPVTTSCVLRTNCLRCGGGLVRYHHWAICPSCEPDMFEGQALPAPTLLKLGRPGWAGRIAEEVVA